MYSAAIVTTIHQEKEGQRSAYESRPREAAAGEARDNLQESSVPSMASLDFGLKIGKLERRPMATPPGSQ